MFLLDFLGLNGPPLDAYPFVRTRDVGELEPAVATMYGGVHFDISRDRERFFARGNRLRLKSMGFSYAAHGARIEIGIRQADFFAHVFAVKGRASARVRSDQVLIDTTGSYICSEGDQVLLGCDHDFEKLIVRFDTTALLNKLTLLVGEASTKNLRFEPASGLDGATSVLERHLVRRMIKIADGNEMSAIAIEELEQAILVAFLFGNAHSHSDLLLKQPSGVAPWQVRRAEQYIEANWARPLLLEDIANASETSVRNLLYTFKRSRGHTPTEFLRRVRLNRAHEMLSNPTPETRVTTVALACGFANVGHFARHFRRQFNEAPLVTLNRGRSRRL